MHVSLVAATFLEAVLEQNIPPLYDKPKEHIMLRHHGLSFIFQISKMYDSLKRPIRSTHLKAVPRKLKLNFVRSRPSSVM